MKTLLIILISAITLSLANDKVVNKIVSQYNPSINPFDYKLTKKQINELCGKNHYSSSCGWSWRNLENELRKKRIIYLLKEISDKYKIDSKSIYEVKEAYIDFIEKSSEFDVLISNCNSDLCQAKYLWVELTTFVESLNSILDNKINEEYPSKKFKLGDIKNLSNINNELILYLKYSKDIDYKRISKEFLIVEESWKEYKVSIDDFLKKIDKYNTEWIRLFYKHRHHDLFVWKKQLSYLKPAIPRPENR